MSGEKKILYFQESEAILERGTQSFQGYCCKSGIAIFSWRVYYLKLRLEFFQISKVSGHLYRLIFCGNPTHV